MICCSELLSLDTSHSLCGLIQTIGVQVSQSNLSAVTNAVSGLGPFLWSSFFVQRAGTTASSLWNFISSWLEEHRCMVKLPKGCAPSWNTSQGRGGIAFCSCQLSGAFLKYQMYHGYDFPLASKFVIMKNSSHYEKLLPFFFSFFLNTIAEITKLVCITSYF